VRFGLIVLVVALVVLPLVVAFAVGADVAGVALGALPSWLVVAALAVYQNWDRFRFWVDRRRLEWTNAETALQLRGEYPGQFTTEDLQGAVAWLHASPDKPRVRVNQADQAVVQFRGFALLLRLVPIPAGPDDGVDVVLVAETTESTHTFRSARRLVPKVAFILESLGKRLQAEEGKFTAHMTFHGPNPYFGFYVQRVKSKALSHFHCEFNEASLGGVVTIREDGVSIVTESLTALSALAAHYLSFGTAPHGLLHQRAEGRY